MRKIRNPRYAPDFLERRLSPSTSAGSLATVAVYSTFDATAAYDTTSDPTLPGDGTPPSAPQPPLPAGPSGPA
jgi:hypothetical protein